MVEYKSLKVTESVYNRVMKDKKHFTKVIGIPFTSSSTLNEYFKILDGIKDE